MSNCLAKEVFGVVKALFFDERSIFTNGAKPFDHTFIDKPSEVEIRCRLLIGQTPFRGQLPHLLDIGVEEWGHETSESPSGALGLNGIGAIDRAPDVHDGMEGWNVYKETGMTARHLRALRALTRPKGRARVVPTRKNAEPTGS